MSSLALVARSTFAVVVVGIVASFGCSSTIIIVAAEDAGGSSESGDSASDAPPADAPLSDAPSTDAPPTDAPCKGSHPLVDAGLRFCGPGDCYCTDKDACYAKASAAGCCAGAVKCTE